MTDFNDRFLRLLRAAAALQTQDWTLDASAVDVLDREGLLALVIQGGASLEPAIAARARARMTALHLRDQLHGLVLERLADLNRRLRRPIMVFKGEAMARRFYPTSVCRQRTDLDLLVDQNDLLPCLAAMEQAGFRVHQAVLSRYARFEVILDAGLPTAVGLDLHIRPFFRPWRLQQRPYAALLADAEALPGWPALPIPAAHDALLIAALHLAKNTHQRAIWWYDLHLLRRVANAESAALGVRLTDDDRTVLESILQTATAMFDSQAASVNWTGPATLSRWQAWRRDLGRLPDTAAKLRFVGELFGFGVQQRQRQR